MLLPFLDADRSVCDIFWMNHLRQPARENVRLQRSRDVAFEAGGMQMALAAVDGRNAMHVH